MASQKLFFGHLGRELKIYKRINFSQSQDLPVQTHTTYIRCKKKKEYDGIHARRRDEIGEKRKKNVKNKKKREGKR
jgi:hypothetical protein